MSAKMKFVNVVAAAAAIAFVTAPMASSLAQAKDVKKPCYGINSCKGRSACKTAKNACKGKNTCKGQGYLMKTEKQCAKKGGSLKEPT